jgi:ankyrin repeat protein
MDSSWKGTLEACQHAVMVEKVDINQLTNDKGMTALHIASEQDQLESVEFLVENGADVNYQSAVGSTPLHFASSNGNGEIVVFLLAHGAEVNAQNKVCRYFLL